LSDSRVKIKIDFSLFETVWQECLASLVFHQMMIWSLIVHKIWLICRKCSQNRY